MESVLRASAIFVFLLLVFRVTGKRSLAQITTFDFVLLLIIGEATQQALLGDDFSVINAWVVIATLMGLDLLLSHLKHRFPGLDPVIDSVPLVVVADGKLIEERAGHERVDLEDVLAAAREKHGLERLEQIKYAVLERSGGLSIIPAPEAR
jgi:uncharacterized membrane protein YcaP (DUF421 family)